MVDFINIKRPSDYENFFQENDRNRDRNKMSFCVILEGEENPQPHNRYHFLLLMNCMGKTYIFDSIGRGESSVSKRKGEVYVDWDTNLLQQVRTNENTFVTDTELQKDSESCADYVIEFFRILMDKYKIECKSDENLFNNYISNFFDPEKKSEKKLQDTRDAAIPFSLLPASFLELSQSGRFIEKYTGEVFRDQLLSSFGKEMEELQEKLNKTQRNYEYCQCNMQKITKTNESDDESRKKLISCLVAKIKEKGGNDISKINPQTEEEEYEYVRKFFESKLKELETESLRLKNTLQATNFLYLECYQKELKYMDANFSSCIKIDRKKSK